MATVLLVNIDSTNQHIGGLKQYGWHLVGDIFTCIVNEYHYILIQISLEFIFNWHQVNIDLSNDLAINRRHAILETMMIKIFDFNLALQYTTLQFRLRTKVSTT